MILNNLITAGNDEPVSISIADGKIANLSAQPIISGNHSLTLTFDNALVFPGLINSHDHLDFNLFPQLGAKKYHNYTEWGNFIHKHYKNEISAVLKIPVALRSEWGMYKNLLCGVTTVINHGEPSGLNNDLITIYEQAQAIHSVHFEKGWKFKLNDPRKINTPVAIHVGEGDDWLAFSEIDQLTKWNLFKRKLIGIHAVAMSENQAKKFEGVVWCPQSNAFLLGKTAPVNLLQKHTSLLFGTDSTLTSDWNIWEHLRSARKTGMLSDEELFGTINKNSANTWQLNTGALTAGKAADLVVAKIKKGAKGFNRFFELNPADLLLVVHQGHIRLFDETIVAQLSATDLSGFYKIYIDGAYKYVQGDLPALMERIQSYYPDANFPVSLTKAA